MDDPAGFGPNNAVGACVGLMRRADEMLTDVVDGGFGVSSGILTHGASSSSTPCWNRTLPMALAICSARRHKPRAVRVKRLQAMRKQVPDGQ